MVDLAAEAFRRSPRWAVVAAYAAPLCILPSAIWRAAGALDGRLAGGGTDTWYPLLVAYAVYRQVWNPIDQIDPDLVLLEETPQDLRPLHERDPAMHREVLWTYSPLAAWPVLLLAVTSAYHRRRTRAAG